MSENVMDFYETLGFEEGDIEDNLTALFYEIDADGEYALVTDDDGAMLKSLNQPVIFACYSADGALQWSASFKNSLAFKEIWTEAETAEQKFAAIHQYREKNEL